MEHSWIYWCVLFLSTSFFLGDSLIIQWNSEIGCSGYCLIFALCLNYLFLVSIDSEDITEKCALVVFP